MAEKSSLLMYPFDYYAVSISSNHAVFRIEPLRRGFGITLGNSLRRVLLSSIRGAAVTAVSIEGVEHEYDTLRSCREDVSEMILNIKGIRFKLEDSDYVRIPVNISGPCEVKAKMIDLPLGVEIVNPEHVICHLDKGAHLNMVLDVKLGEGYVTAEQHKKNDRHDSGFIFIDSLFSPVLKCTYKVEESMVEGDVSFDRLLLTIETNDSIAPDVALVKAATIMRDHLSVFAGAEVERVEVEKEENDLPFQRALLTKVENLELSVRSHNCLKNDNIVYVGDLVTKTEAAMLRTPNFGRKSLNEIKEVLAKMGLKFGMDIEGWPPKNAEELAKSYDDVEGE